MFFKPRLMTLPHLTKPMNPAQSRFTLIELLAAMLLPALMNAKRKAKQISCMNNVKQLYLRAVFYTDDNEETFPLMTVRNQ